jgi:hypothetical protein
MSSSLPIQIAALKASNNANPMALSPEGDSGYADTVFEGIPLTNHCIYIRIKYALLSVLLLNVKAKMSKC